MTAAQSYTVDVVFHGRDDGASEKADRVGVSLESLQGRLGTVTGAMERFAMAGAALGVGAASAGLGMMASAAFRLNSAVQDTTLGIAGMLNAGGAAGTFADGMGQASRVLAQIRRDAAALPGEASDFIRVFQTALPAAMDAGMRDAMNVAKFTNAFGAVAVSFQVDSGQAGRDLRQMLQGRAGADVLMWNNLQSLIGKSAKEFNALTAPQRLAAIQHATAAYGPMVAAFGSTMGTQVSTLKSTAEELLRVGSKPMFDRAGEKLRELNEYLERHGPQIERQVVRWGEQGAHAMDVLGDRVKAVAERGQRAVTWLRDNWRGLAGEVRREGAEYLKVYAGLQALRGGIGLAQGAGGLAGLLRGAGAAGAGGAMAPAAAVAGGLALGAGAALIADRRGVVDASHQIAQLREPARLAGSRLKALWQETEPLVALVGGAWLTGATQLALVTLKVVTVFADLVSIIPTMINRFLLFNHDLLFGAPHVQTGNASSPEYAPRRDLHPSDDLRHIVTSAVSRPPERRNPRTPTHNTTIHNHFKIDQAENPERVALSVLHVIQRELRSPTQSARPGVQRLAGG